MARPHHRHRRPRLEELENRELLTVIMTPQEQLMIELVNRARANPEAEAARYGVDLNAGVAEHENDESALISAEPKQPLAPHQALTDAIGLHTQDMLDRDFFGHDSPDGVTPSARAKNAGYPKGAGENIAWSGNSQPINRDAEVYGTHEDLVQSVGHRINMMRGNWREIGAGVRYGIFTRLENGRIISYQSIMAGTMFGDRAGQHFITGVAINDGVSVNNFYEMGEGLAGVTITAENERTGELYTDVTGPTGGYGIEVPSGAYTVTAVGGRISNPLTVGGVQISGANKKVDFNTRRMPTGDIAGELFHDRDNDGRKNSGDTSLVDRTVFLDLNNDDIHDNSEPTTVTDASGRFVFHNLLPGEYVVRQVLPGGWQETTPGATIVATLRGDNDAVGVQFGSRATTQPPTTVDDYSVATAGQSVAIPVLLNDSDPDDDIDPQSVLITAQPTGGTAVVDAATGSLTYSAPTSFSGTDEFRYSVADSNGARSNEATVQVLVLPAPMRWHNVTMPNDVNNDGAIRASDALVVLREILLHGAGGLAERNQPVGPPYLDVNNDGLLTAADALTVVRFVHLRSLTAAAAVDVAIASALDPHDADHPSLLL